MHQSQMGISGYLIALMIFQNACETSSSVITPPQQVSSESPHSSEVSGAPSKGDEMTLAIKQKDLAIVIPKEGAQLSALEVLPEVWLEQVDEALLASEVNERISDESWPEDWRLVSLRISICSPLGRVADREEIDRLCWPEVRLVFQPIIERIEHLGVIRDFYADDRAIHALYRVQPRNEALLELQRQLKTGARLSDVSPGLLSSFEAERDVTAKALIESALALRAAEPLEHEIDERSEFHNAESERLFWERLKGLILTPYCREDALHELTAFSLPLGRQPASADLWSFVAFKGERGVITQVPLEVLDSEHGGVLFRFDGEGLGALSEDVTSTQGDPALERALSELDPELVEKLSRQVISDTAQLSTHSERINDPYQTLVAHTTCASCHRANNLDFDFHNLSYLVDHEISVSPRVIADVERDLKWSEALWRRLKP